MQKLTYIRCGDYYIPDIRLPEENRPIFVNGQRFLVYLLLMMSMFGMKYMSMADGILPI